MVRLVLNHFFFLLGEDSGDSATFIAPDAIETKDGDIE